MLDTLDTWMFNRLSKILHNGNPVKVYQYWPDREKGKTEYPCLAFERMYFRTLSDAARPNIERAIPSETEVTIDVPPQMSHEVGTTKTGPAGYTITPYPTPIQVFYHVHAMATRKTHASQLQLGLIQAFPPGYTAAVGGQHPVVVIGDIENMDELDVPLFSGICSLSIGPLWIDRLEAYDVSSIQEIVFSTEPDDTEGI